MLKLPSPLGRASLWHTALERPLRLAPKHLLLVPILASGSSTISHPVLAPSGVQSREKPPEESAVPARKRTPSDSHYEKSSPEPSSPRSPTVLSPEVVSTIAANPGGRPKEVRWGGGCAGVGAWLMGQMPPGREKAWRGVWDF